MSFFLSDQVDQSMYVGIPVSFIKEEKNTTFQRTKELKNGFGVEKRFDYTTLTKQGSKESLLTTTSHGKLPRVASLEKRNSISPEDVKQYNTIEKPNRWTQRTASLHIPELGNVHTIGRDSPGPGYNKNFNLAKIQHSRIKSSKKFSVPKEKRELKFNSANGAGSNKMYEEPKSSLAAAKVTMKFNKEKRQLKFPTSDIPPPF